MPTRGKGEGAVYQRSSDGMWCVSVELPMGADKKRRRKVICRKSKPKALEALREAHADLQRHGDIATSTTTLGEWLDYWLPNISAPRSSPGHIQNQRGHINNWIKPAIGSRPLSKLGPQHVRQLHKAVRDGSTSKSLGRNVNATLSKALKDAVRDGKMRSNPCELVDAPRAVTGRQKPLTLEQAITLLGHISARADGALWATYMLTGVRRGEALGLEADRIKDGFIDLSWQLQELPKRDVEMARADYEVRHVRGNLYLTRLKTDKSKRAIPLVDPLRSILALHMQGRGPGFCFTEPDGRPIRPSTATERWKDLLAEADLPDDVVLHGSRHTVVDLLRAAGVPLETAQEIVGHSTRAMTEHYLWKGNMPVLEEAMSKMSALLAQDSPKEP